MPSADGTLLSLANPLWRTPQVMSWSVTQREQRVNWEAVGAIGEMLAAATVVASLLFVGYQLRQSQRAERAAGQRDLLKQGRAWYVSTRSSPEVFQTISELLEEYEEAAPEKQHVFDTWAFDYLLLTEQVLYMHDDEFVNASSREGFENLALSILSTPGGAQWWQRIQRVWNQDHVAHMNRLLQERHEIPRFDDLLPHFRACREGRPTHDPPAA